MQPAKLSRAAEAISLTTRTSLRHARRNDGKGHLNTQATNVPRWMASEVGVSRPPFCERWSDGLICSEAWDPECTWKVLGLLNVLVPETAVGDADNDGLSDAFEERSLRTDTDGDLIPDYLDTDSNNDDVRDADEDREYTPQSAPHSLIFRGHF